MHSKKRANFEHHMKKAGLVIEKERVGNNCFVKIYCPFDRLCYEAEQSQLEMPLKGVLYLFRLTIYL